MPSIKVDLQCENNHSLFLAAYRNSQTVGRIKNLLYCPECNEFYEATSTKVQVVRK